MSLGLFEELFTDFHSDILLETEVEVIQAFDESQALFENGVNG